MNNRGFTLIELLLTIVILGIVISIAVPSYNAVSSAIKDNQRENIVEKIEIAAARYAYDTSKTMIFVDELVTEGYIDSDDEQGNIDDPVNNKRMNCYIVEMSKTSDYYNAKFIDGKNYDNDGECDTNKLKEDSENIAIKVLYSNGDTVNDTSDWISGAIILQAQSNNTMKIDCEVNICAWSSSSGASFTGQDKVELNISGILETKYTFQYTINNDTNGIKRYTASVNLKIDNAAPVIYEKEITVSDRYLYKDNKNVVISASDGKGSGIAGYYLGIYTGQSCDSVGLTYQTSNKFNVTKNGIYLACVKDKMGNSSSYNQLEIKYIN